VIKRGGPIQAPITYLAAFPRPERMVAGGFQNHKVATAGGALSQGESRFPWRATALAQHLQTQQAVVTFLPLSTMPRAAGDHMVIES